MIHADELVSETPESKPKRAIVTKANLIEEVARAAEVPRKEAAVLVELMLDSIVRALHRGDKVEIRELRQLPHAAKGSTHSTQSQNRRAGRCAPEEDSLLQTRQGTSRAG